MENLESHGILEFLFPGLERLWKVLVSVMESHGKLSSLYKIHSAVVCFCESESKNRKLVGHNSENRPRPNLSHGKR